MGEVRGGRLADRGWLGQMSNLTVRLTSPAGRSRIVLPNTATLADLQAEVKARCGVEPESQQLSLDRAGTQVISGQATQLLTQLGIANGTEVHLSNREASIAGQVLTKTPVSVAPEEPVAKASAPAPSASASSSSAVSSSAKPSPAPAAPAAAGDGKKADPKFETFDAFLRKRQYDVLALPGNQKYVTGQIKRGGMMKIPPSVSIKQQPYRHVDTLSIINVPEMENFIGYWNGVLLENAMQRTGFMYGYYLEDKNYDEGTRAIMEGIYEPSQEMVGEIAEPLTDDQEMSRVNRIAEALGLECIGWVFTSLPLEEDLLLSPEEVLRIARLQNEHSTDAHFTRYVLSKFVTCAVRPDPANNGAPSVNPFMVSEQACAMLRDGILSSAPSERRACLVREAKPDELIPDFVVEGRSDKKIATDFFIVRVNDTAPKKHQRMFTHADFPRENRPTHPQRREDLKKYFNKIPKSEPSWSRFADFHLLLYIAKEIDVDTAVAIAECVRDRKDIPEGVTFMFNELTQ